MAEITINIDFGEQIPGLKEELVKGKVDLCNVATGFHAGNADTICASIDFCLKNNILIGAHPSYPDRVHFGRKEMAMSFLELKNHLLFQLGAFRALSQNQNAIVYHVKAHGALYNKAMHAETEAEAIVLASKSVFPECAILVMPESMLENVALSNNMKVLREAFADRMYENRTKLMPRNISNALITDPEKVKQQILSLKMGFIVDVNGVKHQIKADTICVHGDNPNINEILMAM